MPPAAAGQLPAPANQMRPPQLVLPCPGRCMPGGPELPCTPGKVGLDVPEQVEGLQAACSREGWALNSGLVARVPPASSPRCHNPSLLRLHKRHCPRLLGPHCSQSSTGLRLVEGRELEASTQNKKSSAPPPLTPASLPPPRWSPAPAAACGSSRHGTSPAAQRAQHAQLSTRQLAGQVRRRARPRALLWPRTLH